VSFHEVRFPTDISYGSRGGPGYRTKVIELDSGYEQRLNRWNSARRRYDVGYGLKSQDDLYTVYQFFLARSGATYGFKFKDWLDYNSTAYGKDYGTNGASPAKDDQVLGDGDGSKLTFQLIKTYPDDVASKTRNIEKPVSGTVLVALDGTLQTETTDYSVNYTTGVVTFNTAPGPGVEVTAGYEFDVPVRFDVTEDELQFALTDFDEGSIEIPVVEIKAELGVSDERFMGGATHYPDQNTDVTLDVSDGIVHVVEANTALNFILPSDYTNVRLGGPYFWIKQTGTETINVRIGSAGGTLVASITASAEGAVIFCVNEGSGKIWSALDIA